MNPNIKKALILGAVIALSGVQNGFAMQDEDHCCCTGPIKFITKDIVKEYYDALVEKNIAIAKKLAPTAREAITNRSEEPVQYGEGLGFDECLIISPKDNNIVEIESTKYKLLITYQFEKQDKIISIKCNYEDELLEQAILLPKARKTKKTISVKRVVEVTTIANQLTPQVNEIVQILLFANIKKLTQNGLIVTNEENGKFHAYSKKHDLSITYQFNDLGQAKVISIKDDSGIEYIEKYYKLLNIKNAIQQ